MKQRIIKNAKIVTATEEFTGCMVVEGGLIRSIERGNTSVSCAEDWNGQRLGLPVKLHAEQLSDSGGAQLAARYQSDLLHEWPSSNREARFRGAPLPQSSD